MATKIYNATDLQNMKNDLSGEYELANDIDASETATWNWSAARGVYEGFLPIGEWFAEFTGSLDGKGFTISNLYINRLLETTNDFPLAVLGYIRDATIKNINLSNFDISADTYVGSLIGRIHSNCTVSSCHVEGKITVIEPTVGSPAYIGGFIGYVAFGDNQVSDCSANVEIIVEYPSYYIGGFIGYHSSQEASYIKCSAIGSFSGALSNCAYIAGFVGYSGNRAYFEKCFSTVDVSLGDGCSYIGGFAGSAGFSAPGMTFIECYATGDVLSGPGAWGEIAGGFVATFRGEIQRCYSLGDVTCSDRAAGFCDAAYAGSIIEDCYARGNVTTYEYRAAGFIIINNADLRRCYSTGLVSGPDPTLLVGFCFDNRVVITNCFWDTVSSGQATSDGGEGKTTAEMKRYATFRNADWNIGRTYRANPNDGYPFLSWQVESSPVWLITGGGGGWIPSPGPKPPPPAGMHGC